jgi:hypothetical protein
MPTKKKRVWTSRYFRSTVFRIMNKGIKNTEIITELRAVLKYARAQKHLDKMLLFSAETGLWTFRPEKVVKDIHRLFDIYTVEHFKASKSN